MATDSKSDQLDLFGDTSGSLAKDEVKTPRFDRPAATVVPTEYQNIPDVRDGLTREQRVILYTLHEAQKERPGKAVRTLMLYGRVVERMPMSKERFKALLANLVGRGTPIL